MDPIQKKFYDICINHETELESISLSCCYYNRIVYKCSYNVPIENKINKYSSQIDNNFVTSSISVLLELMELDK